MKYTRQTGYLERKQICLTHGSAEFKDIVTVSLLRRCL